MKGENDVICIRADYTITAASQHPPKVQPPNLLHLQDDLATRPILIYRPMRLYKLLQPGRLPNLHLLSSPPGASSTKPQASMPRMWGKGIAESESLLRVKSSERLRPQALTRIRTWSYEGVGMGTSSSLRTSEPPAVYIIAARILLEDIVGVELKGRRILKVYGMGRRRVVAD